MATQNLFEQYGIKEVADVTFYRIEKKEETFESQREISVASMLIFSLEPIMIVMILILLLQILELSMLLLRQQMTAILKLQLKQRLLTL